VIRPGLPGVGLGEVQGIRFGRIEQEDRTGAFLEKEGEVS
jgi:hypothetical protein